MNVPLLTLANLAPALPEIYLTAAICMVLLVDVFLGKAASRVTPTLTLLVLAIAASLILGFSQVQSPVLLFSGMYIADPLATLLKLLSVLVVAITLLYSRHYLEARGLIKGEYYVLTLTALLGIFVIISAGSLLTLYMGVELLSLSLYALVAFDRDSGISSESAIKYFVLGAIASGCLLYGMSLIYGLTGSLLLSEINIALHGAPSLGIIMGVVFLVVGVAFKFGAVPFHMWVPDVYQGAPTSVTLLVASAPKIASFALAYRLLVGGLGHLAETWTQMIGIVAVLSMVVGNVAAIAQTNLKRMLAYSAIGNVGFILLGFVSGTVQGYEAALYYTIAYILMTLGSFGVILLVSRAGFEADELEHYKGLHTRDPTLALIMMILMFSTAGIPPFIGFWAKLQIFQALWGSGQLTLVVIGAAVSVIGVFYYLRVVKLIYFDSPSGDLPAIDSHMGTRFALALNSFAVVGLGIFPQPLFVICDQVLR